MKHLNDILKISIILMVLLIAIGSIHAAEDSQFESFDDSNVDVDLDDGGLDVDDSNVDVDLDDGGLDVDDSNVDVDLDDHSDNDFNQSDKNYTDYDYLEYKIFAYLERYGNCSDENWTESESFINEYQLYLANPSNYTLNKSAEGYETYLKIFDSITSTFKDYDLTDNQTEYLKFLIIYYLNHFGNVSANYTWNESDDFSNFTPSWNYLDTCVLAKASMTSKDFYYAFKNLNTIFNPILGNSTDSNVTSYGGMSDIEIPTNDIGWSIVLLLALIVIMMILIIV